MSDLTRKDFLKVAGLATAGTALFGAGCGSQPAPSPTPTHTLASPSPTVAISRSPTPPPVADQAYLTVVHGSDPAAITIKAIEGLGGISRFVKAGDTVVVKPNICSDSGGPQYAVTTNPIVVATIVKLCRAAGARQVKVMDHPFGAPAETAYPASGIPAAVKEAGGQMVIMSPVGFKSTAIPKGRFLKSWPFYQDILKADVLVNVPIAKDHGTTRLTLGCKNLMGAVVNRQDLHGNLSESIPDLVTVCQPTLTVVDAVRILIANGPTGGSLSDVRRKNTVIASHDIVAADSYAATLFGLTGNDISHVAAAARRGLGKIDLRSIKIRRYAV
jgi:uncharacterized protein (DUF362 family)